jgi:hypothetical protein
MREILLVVVSPLVALCVLTFARTFGYEPSTCLGTWLGFLCGWVAWPLTRNAYHHIWWRYSCWRLHRDMQITSRLVRSSTSDPEVLKKIGEAEALMENLVSRPTPPPLIRDCGFFVVLGLTKHAQYAI